jgi:formiminotetrahydrofolate cyclodeaminase
MPDSIWDSTLASYRDRLASTESVPAGISTAAVTATFALGLMIKSLEIASRRKDFAGDRALATRLLDQARDLRATLSRCADEDIAAFRMKSPAAIDGVPLEVARAAASGLELCEKVEALVHSAVAPDLLTATELLGAAHRAALVTVDSNTHKK